MMRIVAVDIQKGCISYHMEDKEKKEECSKEYVQKDNKKDAFFSDKLGLPWVEK